MRSTLWRSIGLCFALSTADALAQADRAAPTQPPTEPGQSAAETAAPPPPSGGAAVAPTQGREPDGQAVDVPPPPAEAPPFRSPVYPQGGSGRSEAPGYYGTYPAPAEFAAPAGPGAPASQAHAASAPREHDGLFLRLTAGGGGDFTSYHEGVGSLPASHVTTRGFSTLWSLSIGGRVSGNLIVHGDVQLASVYDATKRIDHQRERGVRTDSSLWLLGGGATYYLMPWNAYATAILGIAGLSEARDYDLAFNSNVGLGSSLLLGKEWWVGRQGEWGLGVALRGTYVRARADIGPSTTTLHSVAAGAACSATFN